ncbi:MAG TPA: hypothetical protein VIR54_29455 [Vicinamibacterales bacterium]
MPTGTAEDRLFDDGSLRDLVVGKEVPGLPVFGVRFGGVVDLVQYPASGLVDVLTDVKAPTSFIVGYGFPCVMKQCLFKLRPHFRTDGHDNEDDVHGQ